MKRLLPAGLLLLVTALTVEAQPARPSIYSDPAPPSDEVLRRLNLTKSWARAVPMDGRRDGIATVQFAGDDLLVQTRSGLVVLMDAETGTIRWRQRVGRSYQVTQPLAFNRRSVFVINALYLYALDRRTGSQLWRYTLPAGASTVPLADDKQIYVPTGTGRIDALRVSILGDDPGGKEGLYADTNRPAEPGPVARWSVTTNLSLDLPAIVTRERLFVVGAKGHVQAYDKTGSERGSGAELVDRFDLGVPIDVPATHYGDTAYIGSQGGNVYAYNMQQGKMDWRTTVGARVTRQPVALDMDVFVVVDRVGLVRINRVDRIDPATKRQLEGGQELWRNRDAEFFLAANAKFVYARDSAGRLLVIDRRRGLTLSRVDLRAFRFPISNTTTDRLYLAANNGLIVCLHDRDLPRPYSHVAADAQADPLTRKLATLITTGIGKAMPLRDELARLEKAHGLKFKVVEKAFMAQGAADINGKLVTFPRCDRRPLGQALREMLAPINATFEAEDDTILILPRAARP